MFNLDDIGIVRGGGSSFQARTEDRDTSGLTVTIKRGEVVKRAGTGGNFALRIVDGEPQIGSDIVLGVASSESDETASADGYVEVTQILPGTILRGKATTVANIDTLAKLDLLRYDYITFDVSSLAQTIDENEGDDPNKSGLCILDGDIVAGTLEVAVHINVTLSGSLVGQTID